MKYTGSTALSHWKRREKYHCSVFLPEYCTRRSHSSPKIELSLLHGPACSAYEQRSSLLAGNMTPLNLRFFQFNIRCSASSGFHARQDLNISLKFVLTSGLTPNVTWESTTVFLCILSFYKTCQGNLQDLTNPGVMIELSEVGHSVLKTTNHNICNLYITYTL